MKAVADRQAIVDSLRSDNETVASELADVREKVSFISSILVLF